MHEIVLRKHLNINAIGKARFYTGLSIGILFLIATIGNSMLNIKSGLYIQHYLSYSEFVQIFIHYIGVAAYASGIVILIWFLNARLSIKNKRRYINFGTSQIFIYLILFNSTIFNTSHFSHNPVTLQQMQDMLIGPYLQIIKLLSAPLLFYINWNMIRLAFNCRKFVFINLIIGISFALLCLLLHCI